jgi:alpha-galactosidase
VRTDDPGFANVSKQLAAMRTVIAPNMWGDYYPLTPYSLAGNSWLAWQFDRPEEGQGMVQAFRRDGSDNATQTLRLQGLNAKDWYSVTNLDGGSAQRVRGKDLMEHGITIEIPDKPGAAIYTYKKVR